MKTSEQLLAKLRRDLPELKIPEGRLGVEANRESHKNIVIDPPTEAQHRK